ncbi:hypothetical protein SDC9_140038 [bioreactor metagenome]|uniref:Uncharacterized protein n=1 Tax=bioreactor metagenome TaxID=1076179 RepID=A0A645DX39_9ZZZZ
MLKGVLCLGAAQGVVFLCVWRVQAHRYHVHKVGKPRGDILTVQGTGQAVGVQPDCDAVFPLQHPRDRKNIL